MFWTKVFTTRSEIIVAICDEELLDKEIEFKRTGAKIKVSKHFYGEHSIDDNVALKLLKSSTIGNLIGKKIVELATRHGFISNENVIDIDGTPHAQFVKLEEKR